jgi:hypothetical protein
VEVICREGANLCLNPPFAPFVMRSFNGWLILPLPGRWSSLVVMARFVQAFKAASSPDWDSAGWVGITSGGMQRKIESKDKHKERT